MTTNPGVVPWSSDCKVLNSLERRSRLRHMPSSTQTKDSLRTGLFCLFCFSMSNGPTTEVLVALRAACRSSKPRIQPSVSDAAPELSPLMWAPCLSGSLTSRLSWHGDGRLVAVIGLAFARREGGKATATVGLGITAGFVQVPGSPEGIFLIFSLLVGQFCMKDTDPTSQRKKGNQKCIPNDPAGSWVAGTT